MIERAGHSRLLALLISLLWLTGCDDKKERPLFKLLSADQTGITFANTVTTSDSLNVQTDLYVYNGAGVAIGDIDNDGLPDIFFSGNMVSSRLYLNKGQMRFDDITVRAGVTTKRWATGATMVDINGDGYLDIYVSVSGPERTKPEDRANLLFINNRNRSFTESAAQYGIADTGFATHSVFLDYDSDGCLDLFILNNSPKDFAREGVGARPAGLPTETPGSYNELFRNDCRGKFTNVSNQTGILREAGYGLGVVVSDLNGDYRPDIYVSNDASPNDVLYVGNANGTFSNKAGQWLKHASLAGMGVDIADFNNDGSPDILQVDMMPRDLSRRKRVSGYMTYSSLLDSRSRGVRDDYSINTLQLNNGATSDGDVVFSEIARLAGVAATEWSWSALFADFDNDGNKDIFIGNGYPKAVNDFDYQSAAFAARRGGDTPTARRRAVEMLNNLYAYHVPNHVFRNSGDLTFADKTNEWGMNQPSFSYGAAYADLDNDGQLDLVVNNIDAPAFVYANVGGGSGAERPHYLQVKLQGDAPNRRGIGATLILTAGGQKQHLYHSPYRGYMSSMDDRAHFGLGRFTRADSLEVIWPDGRHQLLTGVEADRLLIVKQIDATTREPPDSPPARDHFFQAMDARQGLAYKHQTGTFVDYSVQPLLPYMLSRQGPPLAAGDVNGDKLDDVFIGGAAGVPGRLFIQRKDGGFVESIQGQPWKADEAYEDWGALFFDANGDSLPDLYVASGGYQLAPGTALLQDRIYINKGGGRFARDARALPTMLTSTGTVRAADFTGDGRPDVFVGGRLTPRNYPLPTRSYLLRNDGGGRFTDVTAEFSPELINPGGMITDAVWIDFDGDARLDLVTVGEWMPIQFYRNNGRGFSNVTKESGVQALSGWWYSLAAGDFDKDGRLDLVAGNLGLNYTYTTSTASRFGVYAADFTGNRTTDIVLTQEVGGTEYPFAGLVPLGREIYTFALRYPTYASFSQASLGQILGSRQPQQGIHYQANTFATVYLHNTGGGTFSASALPNHAQFAPVKGIITYDVDGDGHLDLVVAGNLYDAEPNTPRADAGNGLWLRGNGRGSFIPVPSAQSGFLAPRNVSGLALINTPTGKAVLVANTGDSLQAFTIRSR